MKFGTIIKTAAAAALMTMLPANAIAAAPVRAAQALPSTTVALPADARSGADLQGENEQYFESGWLLPAIVVIAVGVGIYFLFIEDESDSPNN